MAEKGKRCSEVYNISNKLQSREIGNRWAIRNAHSRIKFRNFQLQEKFDTNQPSKIVQILSARSIIIALARSGLCTAFDRHTNKRLCYLNLNPHEQIRRLYYNKENNSLITMSDPAPDRFSNKYRTTSLEYIRRAQPDGGFALFEGEKLLMLDSINGKAITFSAQDHTYKVFDLKNYTVLYSISDKEIEDIKITSGMMLLISKRTTCGSSLPLKILSIEDGKVLKSFHHALLPNKKVHFVELLHGKILLEQENECLQLIDIQSEKMIELSKEFKKAKMIIFLNRKGLFMGFHSDTVFVWNSQGKLIASYRNHFLRLSGFKKCFVKLSSDEELLISYNNVGEADKTKCSINIINILTGDWFAKIGGDDPDMVTNCRNRPNLSVTRSTIQDALEDITALFYDEDTNEIYTGDTRGFVHVWSN
ncbi:hypothetical protein SUGI_1172210 [Cryptomeria japonica]|uniref:uncharacterized protein LOC131068272 n=1 Tax=Cryptomeria japonica TaxID=3369 RepID=UPI002414AB67|nr:uncharacterized protein LOC131068272 [Cryptomeria japonica]GLJ54575.1 hypothetical protein SUGI_1172210 [Cryptomeria japonica]